MGYACPVCGHPQSDARHLANHLAFTALARGGDHEAWLDDRVPEWESLDETALGDRVADHADPVEFLQVFEDTTPRGSAEDHSHGHTEDGPDHTADGHTGDREGTRDPRLGAAQSRAAEEAFSDDTADVLAEARELTRRRRENAARPAADGDGGNDSEEGADGGAESETE